MALPGISSHMISVGSAAENIIISANTNNVNLFTLAGSPTTAKIFNFTINSGVVIGSTSTGTAALVTGAFPSGSVVNLINNGSVYGKGGNGGAGGGDIAGTLGAAGAFGGPAMSLGFNVTITNASGSIFGGGGGGGGGPATMIFASTFGGGYGGSGGQGSTNSSGGAGGVGQPSPDADGGPGNSGTSAAPGAAAGSGAWIGGAGGVWGTTGESSYAGNPSPGGAAGKAIALNGFSATFLSGNDSTHVKGAVS